MTLRPLFAPILALALVATLPGGASAEKSRAAAPSDVRVGDWIEHKLVMPADTGMTSTTRQTVVKVTDTELTIEVVTTTAMGGKAMAPKTSTITRPRSTPAVSGAPALVPAKLAEEKVKTSSGQELSCKVYQVVTNGKKAKSYKCAELPLGGLVKTEVDGKLLMDVTGWGRGK